MLGLGKALRILIGVAAVWLCGVAGAAALTVAIGNVAEAKGELRVVVYDAETWLSREQWVARKLVPADGGSSFSVVFEVPSGTYAVAVLHDVNGNGKMDRVLRLPQEPYGFSNAVVPRFGPPKFKDASFNVGENDVSIAIELRN